MLETLQASSMPPTFTRHVQKVSRYLSGILIVQVPVVENNDGQKVCITAWQFSTFNLSRNKCPHSELSYFTNLHRLVPNPGKIKNKKLLPHLDHLGNIFYFLFFVDCRRPYTWFAFEYLTMFFLGPIAWICEVGDLLNDYFEAYLLS